MAFADADPRVWATIGVHPHEAKDLERAGLERLRTLAASARTVAVGEIGLDYHYDHSPRQAQVRASFELQLELADDLGLPVVIHSRDADADTFAILSAWSTGRRGSRRQEPFGVMHCYAYGPDRMREYVEIGLFISIPGIVTYPRAEQQQQTATLVDDEVLVLETDCPYLAPQSTPRPAE